MTTNLEVPGPTSEVGVAVRFILTADDFVDGYLLGRRREHLLYVYGFAAASIVGLSVAVVVPGYRVAGMLVAVASALLCLLNANRTVIRWQLARSRRARLGTECEVELSETGVFAREAGTTVMTQWSAINGILEDRRSLIVTRSGGLVVGIPKRAFRSPEELLAFRAFVVAHSTPTEVSRATAR